MSRHSPNRWPDKLDSDQANPAGGRPQRHDHRERQHDRLEADERGCSAPPEGCRHALPEGSPRFTGLEAAQGRKEPSRRCGGGFLRKALVETTHDIGRRRDRGGRGVPLQQMPDIVPAVGLGRPSVGGMAPM